jgi:isopentenyl-diphosphate delta-isomerase
MSRAPSPARRTAVSSEDDLLILVDSGDRQIGTLDKARCHDGSGRLHRAFSLFVFNARGELLLQQRAPGKRLWGGYWSNTCCSHPRAGESMERAVHRRLEEELGLSATLGFVYKFEYHALFGTEGSEHELCWVWVGQTGQDPSPHPGEISDWRWITPAGLDSEMATAPDRFTPWFRLEWERLRSEYPDTLPVVI